MMIIKRCKTSKKEENSEELEIVNKPTEHLLDLIVSPLPGKPISSPEEKDIDQKVVNEDQIIEAAHIDLLDSKIRRSYASNLLQV